MSRVKRGVTAHAKHKKVLRSRQGLFRPPQEHHPRRQGGGRKGDAICLSRPQEPQARVPRAVDPAHQRGGARARPHLQPLHLRPDHAPASKSTARCFRTSPSPSRRPSPRSSRRPRATCPRRRERDPLSRLRERARARAVGRRNATCPRPLIRRCAPPSARNCAADGRLRRRIRRQAPS